MGKSLSRPVIAKTFMALRFGDCRVSSPPPARSFFKAAMNTAMPLESMKLKEDKSTFTVQTPCSIRRSISSRTQRGGGDVQFADQPYDRPVIDLNDIDSELSDPYFHDRRPPGTTSTSDDWRTTA